MRTSFLLAGALALATLPACSKGSGTTTSPTPTTTTTVELDVAFEGDGYTIQPPEGWEVNTTNADADVIFSDPADQGASNINVRSDSSGGLSFEATIDAARAQLQEVFEDYEFIVDESITVNGATAHRFEARLSSQGIEFHNVQSIVEDGDLVWSVTATSTEENWAEREATFRASLETFTLI